MILEATKLCSGCGQERPLTAFYAGKTNGRCRDCTRVYQRAWYRRNRGPTYIECRECGHKLQTRGVRGLTLETGVCAACRRPKLRGDGNRLDHDAVRRRLLAGDLYRDIAMQLGCALSTVKAIARRYGLQRTGKRPAAATPAWRTRKVRWLIEQHGGDHMAAAVEAFRRAEQWREDRQRRRGPGVQSEFRDVTAEDVVDVAVEDWKQRVRLMCKVLDRAKEGKA